MRSLLPTLIALIAAAPAPADVLRSVTASCSFSHALDGRSVPPLPERLGGLPIAGTRVPLPLGAPLTAPETRSVFEIAAGGGVRHFVQVSSETGPAAVFLTLYPDGRALLTRHEAAPGAGEMPLRAYAGTCKVQD